LGERGPDDLRAIDLRNLPVELAPLLAATNRMMQRVDVALRSEREFVAAAAHELRTPLAGLRAQAELAAHPRTDAPARAEALRAVQDGVDHAAHLVGQLLDLARSDALAGDAQREALARQPVDLRELLAQLMPELGPPLAERDVQLRQALEVPVIDGSAVALALILRNLLANAVAHARPGGVVSIATRRQAGCTVLVVEDDGPGVPEAERARLCERFYRGRNPAAPGCGLGLAIVKALADAHGATIAFDRASLGGLAVRLSFPS
jgi:signal transduction histidine kinase